MNILKAWKKLSPLPGGRYLFSKILGRYVPYSGTMGANVVELGPGHSRLELPDRRKVRNHLNSVHAVALMNFAELTSGLALNAGLGNGVRSILVKFSIEYVKKARGTLYSEAHVSVPVVSSRIEHPVTVTVTDASGTEVCTATATWLLEKVG